MSKPKKLFVAWWVQLGATLLAIPWGYWRAETLFSETPKANSLGEGAFWGYALGIGLVAAIIITVLYVLTLVVLTAVSVFASQAGRGPGVVTILLSLPWAVVFFVLGLVDGVLPIVFSLIFLGLAAVGGAHLQTIAAQRQAATPPPPMNFIAQPPPPSTLGPGDELELYNRS